MFAAVAIVGMQILGGLLSNSAQKAAAKAQGIVDQANASAKNVVRDANNKVQASESSLANLMRSINNNNTMKAAGEQYNALGENLSRSLDQATTGTFQARLQAAEQVGSLMASASASGVGGSTVNMINGAMALRNAQVNEIQDRQIKYATYDTTQKMGAVLPNAVKSLDYGTTFANIDYGQDIAPYRAQPSMLSAILGATANSLPAIQTIAGNIAQKSGSSVQTVGSTNNSITPVSSLTNVSANPESNASFADGLSGMFSKVTDLFKSGSTSSASEAGSLFKFG